MIRVVTIKGQSTNKGEPRGFIQHSSLLRGCLSMMENFLLLFVLISLASARDLSLSPVTLAIRYCIDRISGSLILPLQGITVLFERSDAKKYKKRHHYM
jgi:hypothetical protein